MYGGNNSLGRLTFEFPGDVRGPPAFTYDKEPDKESPFLGNSDLKKFIFGINEPKAPIFFLNTLQVINQNGEIECDIKGSEQPASRLIELEIKETETIVGVRITTEGSYFPVAISFYVFDLARLPIYE